jgi:uncharacterized protein (DUF2267 family)
MVVTRREFLTDVKNIAGYKSLREADIVPRAVVAVLKRELGVDISDNVAEVLAPDLREGWETVKSADSEIRSVIK